MNEYTITVTCRSRCHEYEGPEWSIGMDPMYEAIGDAAIVTANARSDEASPEDLYDYATMAGFVSANYWRYGAKIISDVTGERLRRIQWMARQMTLSCSMSSSKLMTRYVKLCDGCARAWEKYMLTPRDAGEPPVADLAFAHARHRTLSLVERTFIRRRATTYAATVIAAALARGVHSVKKTIGNRGGGSGPRESGHELITRCREEWSAFLLAYNSATADNHAPTERFDEHTPPLKKITEGDVLFARDAIHRYTYNIIAAVLGTNATTLREYVNKGDIHITKWGRKAKGEEDLMACRAEWEHWKTKHER